MILKLMTLTSYSLPYAKLVKTPGDPLINVIFASLKLRLDFVVQKYFMDLSLLAYYKKLE